jgi:hypothetical protein
MRISSMKRRIGALAAGVAMAAGLGLSAAAPASASTIPNGKIQICAQGNYPVFIHILPRSLGNGATTHGLRSAIFGPGQCWIFDFNTLGGANQVDVVGLRPDGSEFYIGSQWWNSSTGLGLGAQGSPSNAYIWQW